MQARWPYAFLTLVLLNSLPSQALPWPDFRGRLGDGCAPAASDPPVRWSEKQNVRFKVEVPGSGWSSPVVGEGRIWLTTAAADGSAMSVLAFDAATGAKIHDRVVLRNEVVDPKNRLNSYASPSPVLEAGRVYVHFGSYGTVCLDAKTAATRWVRRDIRCDHMEGPGASPLLWGNLLVCSFDGGDVQFVIALDKATGKTAWKTDRSTDLSSTRRDMRKAFSTPIAVPVDGKTQIVCTGAQGTMAYDPEDGRELWKLPHTGFSMSARPIARDGTLYLTTGFMSARLLAVRIDGTGTLGDEHLAWTYRRSVPRMASPVLHDDLIYMVSDDGIATCVDRKTGKKVWKTRLDGRYCASPIAAGDRIYFCSREGQTVVLQAGRVLKELARNDLGDGFMASPAVLGDSLILRSRTHLYRIEAAAEATPDKAGPTASWTRFRGANGSGITEGHPLPATLDPQSHLRWKTALPAGHSSPVVAGPHLFLTAEEGDNLFTYCIRHDNGKILWRQRAPRPRRAKFDKRNNAAAASPAADADAVVVFFEEFGLLAYSHAGEELWRHPLEAFDNEYGMGASPILHGDSVFLACDQTNNSYLLAVDKRTGKTRWKQPRPQARSGHCTPIVYRPPTGNAQIILPGSFLLDAYDAITGERVWWVRGLSFEMKSTPILHDGVIYIHGYASPMNQRGSLIKLPDFDKTLARHDADQDGLIDRKELPKFRGAGMFFGFVDLRKDGKLDREDWAFLRAALASENGLLAIRAGGKGDMTAESILWSYHRTVPQLPSPLLYHGVLYLVLDQGGILVTLDPKSGKVLRRGRLKDAMDNYYASPVAGDGKIYLASEGGLISILPARTGEQTAPSLEPLATVDLGASCYATPAIHQGRIYVRTTRGLSCFGIQ